MPAALGLEFHRNVLGPSLVNGLAQAGLYGLIAVALVLTFRVSRTVAFLHGGLVLMGAIFYWLLVMPNRFGLGGRPELHPWMGLVIVMALGALIAGVYGLVVTGDRMAGWPRVTLTTFSLAMMLLLGGIMFQTIQSEGSHSITPFGHKTFKIFGQYVSSHQITILAIIAVVVTALSAVLRFTRTGIFVRAIADNVVGSRLVGVPINRVGTGVYALSGLLSALSGAALGAQIGLDVGGLLGVFLRALMVSVLGGFASLSLALAGAVVVAVAESMLRSGVLGSLSLGVQETFVFVAIFAAVIVVNKVRPQQGRDALVEGI